MPRMTERMAKEVEASNEGFAIVPAGTYIVKLVDVSVVPDKDPMQWKWVYSIPKWAPENAGRKFFVRTSFSDNAKWKVAEQYAAFGASTDTDTDELCGRWAKLVVTVGTVPPGYASSGNETNNVEKTMPCTDEEALAVYGPEPGEDADLDDVFGSEDDDEDPI